jgi:cobalt-zinc-cadmium efflux system protein
MRGARVIAAARLPHVRKGSFVADRMPHTHSHSHASHGHRHGAHVSRGRAHGHPKDRHGFVTRGAVSSRLLWVLALTGSFMIAELVGGLWANSLALVADAGHMLADVAALALSVIAMRMAARPPSLKRTFGWVRLEILAALLNGAALLVISGFIVLEAWQRLREPQVIQGPLMLTVAALGLGVNAVGAVLLHGHAHDNLNVRGAYLHVLGDLLGSVGAIAAAVVVLATGWTPADAVASALIALLIVHSAWQLMRESADVLMEAVPPHVEMDAILEDLAGIPGLHEVHDVHVWTLTSGFVAIAAHGVIDDPLLHMRVLEAVQERMRGRGIEHVTFQIELRTLHQLPARSGADPARLPGA